MKATTKLLAVLWALVLAVLWLPQAALAGYCPDSGNCCDTDADCAGEGEPCIDPFGVCASGGQLCEADLDCGGHCKIKINTVCSSNDDCVPLACNVPPRIPCLVDANCWEGGGTCEPNPCVADEACLKDPAAKGVCDISLSACIADGDCPDGEYCVLPGNCSPSGDPCDAGQPTGTCSDGDIALCDTDADCAYCSDQLDQPCSVDSDCRTCSADGKPCTTTDDCLNKVCITGANKGLLCYDDGDCNDILGACNVQTCGEEVCVKEVICLTPHAPAGQCDGTGPTCQDDGDCPGGSCVFSGSCTTGTCSGGDVGVCSTDEDCGTVCSNDAGITGCGEDLDCGTVCSNPPYDTGCAEDVDCGLKCTASGYACTTDANCRKECFDDGTQTFRPCTTVAYCVTNGFCEDEGTCECKLIEGESCQPAGACELAGSCQVPYDCNLTDPCTTAQKQVCTDQLWKGCTSDDECSGCLLSPNETCATNGDCPDRCSVSGAECTGSCPDVCSETPEIACLNDAGCEGVTNVCVSQTCDDNSCKGTCADAFKCRKDDKCFGQTCTVDDDCSAISGAVCTGDFYCCTGTCGTLEEIADPQCDDGSCEACFDTGPPPPVCTDVDGDGYGDPASTACTHSTRDCDDSNAAVNPGATEGPYGDATCSDTLDNDCDTKVDGLDDGCANGGGGTCTSSTLASTGDTVEGSGASAWYLLLLAGVIAISAGVNRALGRRKE